jgi:hypothetical protein
VPTIYIIPPPDVPPSEDFDDPTAEVPAAPPEYTEYPYNWPGYDPTDGIAELPTIYPIIDMGYVLNPPDILTIGPDGVPMAWREPTYPPEINLDEWLVRVWDGDTTGEPVPHVMTTALGFQTGAAAGGMISLQELRAFFASASGDTGVPEPSSLALCGLACLAAGLRRPNRR